MKTKKKCLEICKTNDKLILSYTPKDGTKWLEDYFSRGEKYHLRKVVYLSSEILLRNSQNSDFISNDKTYHFIIANLENDFFKFNQNILETSQPVFIEKTISITTKMLGLDIGINIIKELEKLLNEEIVIGGENENSIPFNEFEHITDLFPTDTEKNHYLNKRIFNILNNFVSFKKDYNKAFENYINKKETKFTSPSTLKELKEYECSKYQYLHSRLKDMLRYCERHSENDWQNEILDFITLLYPKYILTIKELRFTDTFDQKTTRKIDITLIDKNGSIDIIEIKKPHETNNILTTRTYRDNYIPSRELTGAIMQTEKYITHLRRLGTHGESSLSEKYKDILEPFNISIKLTNPKGIIIAGRDPSPEQLLDFEIIKRKYSNITDIVTYDDLLRRLEQLIHKYQDSAPHRLPKKGAQ